MSTLYVHWGLEKKNHIGERNSTSTDFTIGLLISAHKKYIVLVIGDKLTNFAHFIPIHASSGMERRAPLYDKEMVRLHGIPKDIVSYFESLTHRLVLFSCVVLLSYINCFIVSILYPVESIPFYLSTLSCWWNLDDHFVVTSWSLSHL